MSAAGPCAASCSANGRFYYRMHLAGKGQRRIPLLDAEGQSVRTVARAVAARDALRVGRRAGEYPARTPGFEEFKKHYLTHLQITEAKSPLTVRNEACALRGSEQLTASELRGRITTEIDQARKLTELAALEGSQVNPQWRQSLFELADIVEHAQATYVVSDILSGEAELEEWSRFDPSARAAEAALRSRVADYLDRTASVIELGHPPLRCDLESSFAAWDQTMSEAAKGDRFRLIQRLVEEIPRLATV